MANLRFARFCAVINLPVHDQSAADAAAERDVKDRIEPDARAVQRFTKRPRVRVVIHTHRQTAQGLQPVAESEIGPTFNLVRATDLSRLPIHGTTEADANGRRLFGRNQFSERRANLPANSGAALVAIHREVPPLDDFRGTITKDDLELRAADFDADVMSLHWSLVGRDSVDPIGLKRD